MGFKKACWLVVALKAALGACQGAAYAQCGGSGWTGPTTCVSGYTCVKSNAYYSQCVPGGGGGGGQTTARPTTTRSVKTTTAAVSNRSPTLYLCGDSTMAKNGANDGYTDGWGNNVAPLVSIPVVNSAIGGRSARSYTREGRFASVIAAAKAGDYVVIEFGHNDGGSLKPTDNGRSDCPGTGEQTCQTTYSGASETVLTFFAYERNAAQSLKAKGVDVIISSQTPNNLWESGSWSYSTPRFATDAKAAATATGVTFVDHGWFVADRYKKLGAATVNSYYPRDHTHTSLSGAKTVAQTFIRGLLCGNSGLKNYLSTAGKSVASQTCGGI